MANILIIEDEPQMRLGLKDNLEFEGHSVEFAEDGKIGLEKIQSEKYDLVLLDVMLPKMSGFDVCKKTRQDGNQIPIIMLTAKGEEIDKVLGLEIGADDYITKPFSLRELLARINAVLRRIEKSDSKDGEKIIIGKLDIDFDAYNAYKDGKSIAMTHKEFEILKLLCRKKNETVSRSSLLDEVWGYDQEITTRTVDNFILKLRHKIEENSSHPKIILTVHGIGYKLVM